MRILVELTEEEVCKRSLSDRGLMAVDRALMDALQEMHPEMMVYHARDDSYRSARSSARRNPIDPTDPNFESRN
jgi:hypothetical protein